MGLLDQIRSFLGGAGNEIQQHVIQPVEQSFQRIQLPPVNFSKLPSQAANYFNNPNTVGGFAKNSVTNLPDAFSQYTNDIINNRRNIMPYANTSQDTNLLQTGAKKLYNFGGGLINHVAQEGIIKPVYDLSGGIAANAYGQPITHDTFKSGAFRLGADIAGGGINAQNTLADVGQTLDPILNAYGGGKLFGFGKAGVGIAEQTIPQIARQSSKFMGRVGLVNGLAQGFQDNKDKSLGSDLLNSGISAGAGYLGGRALGFAMPYAGQELGQLTRDFSNRQGKMFNPATIFDKNKRMTNAGALISSGGDHPQMLDPNAFRPESFTMRMFDKTGGTPVGLSVKDVSGEINAFKQTGKITENLKKLAGVTKEDSVMARNSKIAQFVNLTDNQDSHMLPKSGQNPQLAETQSPIAMPKENQPQSQLQLPKAGQPMDQGRVFSANVDRSYGNNISVPNGNVQPRGFVSSIKEANTIGQPTKADVSGFYVPKSNTKLMGEAQAMLSEGGSLDFKNTKDLDKKVAATIQEAINLDKSGNHDAAANLFNNLSEHGTELGRGVQAFNLLDKMSPEAISLSVAGKIKKYNQNAVNKIPELNGQHMQMIGDFVDKIRGMEAGREKNIAINEFNKNLSQLFPSSVADKAIAVWKAGLLTSLRTHERNLLGNTVMLGSEVAKDIPATLADKFMSFRTGQRTTTSTLSGLREFGSAQTRQQIKDLVMRGYDPSEDIGKFDLNRNITWDNTPVQQFLKKYTEAVFRPLGAEDRAFFNTAFKRSLYDQAGAEAINAGQKGNKEFIKNLVENPNENMLAGATKDANYATFHDKNVLGGTASSIKRWLGSQQGLKGEVGKIASEVLMPFTGVPSSIATKTVAYSPIGLVKGAYSMGKVMVKNVPEFQRQAAQEIGRGVMGTGIFGIGAYLMNKGLMTGQPKDAKEADLWAAQGKMANSVLIGGKWRSVNSIGPQNLVALAGAKFAEEMGKPDGSVGAYAGGLAKDQLSQTFLAGVQGPLNAITDPARYGQSYVGNQTASIVPNIVKDMSKAVDASQRENNTIKDYFTNSIPGLRNQNIPKRDVLGNVMPQEPTGAAAFYDLFNSKSPISNPVVDELSRLNGTDNSATPSKLKNTQTVFGQKLKLSPEELNNLEAQSGGALRPALESLVTSDGYKSLSDEDKAAMIQKTISGIRTQAKNGLATGNAPATSSGTGSFDASNLDKKNKLALEKLNFENSGKKFQQKDGYTYSLNPDGTTKVQSDVAYKTELNTALMTQALNNKDEQGWMKLAQDQWKNLTEQINDPDINPAVKAELENKLTALIKKAVAVKKGKKPKKVAMPKLKNAKISANRTVIGGKSATTKKLTLKDLYSIKR